MQKGKHITPEDIETIFKGEGNANAAEEELLELLQHLAACSECLERIKAHRRLEILLRNWTPELHGKAFRKAEYLKRQDKGKQAGDDGNPHSHTHGKECNCGGDCDCGEDEEFGDDCGCGHDHGHKPYAN